MAEVEVGGIKFSGGKFHYGRALSFMRITWI